MIIEGYPCIVYDFEVFAHDWLCCFEGDEGRYSIWNNPAELIAYFESHDDALFVGYNSSHYDVYIAKAICAGCAPEEVKEVNDWIVGTDNLPWEHPYLKDTFWSYNDVDIMKDTQVGTSLKSIEAHMGLDIRESSVPFDIDRPLTDEEREEVERYCQHDVSSTLVLLKQRADYLLTKAKLGQRAGIDVPKAVSMTNAKLTAAVLDADANLMEIDDEREYEFPLDLNMDWIPQEVVDFFERLHDETIPDEELWSSKLEIEVGGCPVTLGFGGIHGALPKWEGESDGATVLVNADVASYYPSLMVYNLYQSRKTPDPTKFGSIYRERLEAKKAGDKETADALKLVVNTAYGAMLNEYNDLYDPRQARSVCISGQLYLLELANHLVNKYPELVLVQLNTDGILVQYPRKYGALSDVFGEWQKRTKFILEFDEVERIAQKDVNNYAMRLANGKEKVKGGYLVRGVSRAGAYSINNNAVIVAEALKAHLLDGTPIRETIMACEEPVKFQIVAKASHKYSRVYQIVDGEEIDMQKCNRVFASVDETPGRLYKVKREDGSVAKIESLPEHCLISNHGMPDMKLIDKQWYIALAEKRALDFKKEEETDMATSKTTKAVQKATEVKTPNVGTKSMNVFQKLILARRMFLDEGVTMSGRNQHLEIDYYELKDIAPVQTRIFEQVGLVEQFFFAPAANATIYRNNEGLIIGTEPGTPLAKAIVYNVDKPEEYIEFVAPWKEMPVQTNKDGRPTSNVMQEFGKAQTYLRRYLKMQVLDLSASDVLDAELDPSSKEKAESASKPAKPATASRRKAAAKSIAAADGEATQLQKRQLKKALTSLKKEYGNDRPEVGAFVAEIGVETENLEHVSKARCEEIIQKLGEMREQFETETDAS